MVKILDKITDNAKTGDLVRCCNCGKIMLVDIGEETCPECKTHALYCLAAKQKHNICEAMFWSEVSEIVKR